MRDHIFVTRTTAVLPFFSDFFLVLFSFLETPHVSIISIFVQLPVQSYILAILCYLVYLSVPVAACE